MNSRRRVNSNVGRNIAVHLDMLKTRKLIWFIAAVLTLCAGASVFFAPRHYRSSLATLQTNDRTDGRMVYINQDLKWETVSKQLDHEAGGYRFTTNERVLIFFSDGTFASIRCVLQQSETNDEPMFIPNNGFGVYKGTWKLNGDGSVTLTSQLVSSNKLSDDAIAKGHQPLTETLLIREVTTNRAARRFELGGRSFIPGPRIDGLRELLLMPPGDI